MRSGERPHAPAVPPVRRVRSDAVGTRRARRSGRPERLPPMARSGTRTRPASGRRGMLRAGGRQVADTLGGISMSRTESFDDGRCAVRDGRRGRLHATPPPSTWARSGLLQLAGRRMRRTSASAAPRTAKGNLTVSLDIATFTLSTNGTLCGRPAGRPVHADPRPWRQRGSAAARCATLGLDNGVGPAATEYPSLPADAWICNPPRRLSEPPTGGLRPRDAADRSPCRSVGSGSPVRGEAEIDPARGRVGPA